ncbi:MAG TPA: ABC transporter permease [Gemmatales bacterium]|nr:ABC transporter permease [Gemmatales bacterium]
MRWPILRTLLWKEALRYRYNWGLLVMVAGVLAISALIALGNRMGDLPSASSRVIKACIIHTHHGSPEERAWRKALEEQPPEWFTEKNRIPLLRGSDPNAWRQPGLIYPDDFLIVSLQRNTASSPEYVVKYQYSKVAQQEAMQYRGWINQVTHQLRGLPVVEEVLPVFHEAELSEGEDRTAKIITALVIFSFYLLSFNLYITSTAEEREKKILLALLLTPAHAREIIAAKVIFYAMFSLLVSAGVVALFDFTLLLKPLLWTTILCGSISYVCIGTVVLCIIRRQSTINTVSMMYLIVTALVMSLSTFLLPFLVLRFLMIENYLFHQLEFIIAGKRNPVAVVYHPIMAGLTAGWFLLAVFVFSRKGISSGQAR